MKRMTSLLAVFLLATVFFKEVTPQGNDGQSKSVAATPGDLQQSNDEHKQHQQQQQQQQQRDLQQNAFQKFKQLEKEAADESDDDEDDDGGDAYESGFLSSFNGDVTEDGLLQEDKRYKPRFVGKRYQPRFVGKRYQPRFVGKRYKPRFVGRRRDGEQANEAVHTIAKRSPHDPYDPNSYWWDAYQGFGASSEDDSSDSSGFGFDQDAIFAKRGAPRFVGKRQAPRFVGKRQAPRFVGKRSLYRRGGAPRFVGKRQAPRFVGKRESDDTMMALIEALESASYKTYDPRLHGKRDTVAPVTLESLIARGDDYVQEYLRNWSRNMAIKRHQSQPRTTASAGEGGIIGKRNLGGSGSVGDADNLQDLFL